MVLHFGINGVVADFDAVDSNGHEGLRR